MTEHNEEDQPRSRSHSGAFGVQSDSEYEVLSDPEGFSQESFDGVVPYRGNNEIRLMELYEPDSLPKKNHRHVYLKGEQVIVEIVSVERTASYFMNPYLYTIRLTHGDFQWIIKKRYKHFNQLHGHLKLFRARLNIPIPTAADKNRRKSVKPQLKKEKKERGSAATMRFPKKPDYLVNGAEQREQRQKQLEDYLSSLLTSEVYRSHDKTLEFLEVSKLSFVLSLGEEKGKEAMIRKRVGEQNKQGLFNKLLACFKALFPHYHLRWLIVKGTFLCHFHPDTWKLREVMLMDQGFSVRKRRTSIYINNLSRELVIRCWTKRKAEEWKGYIETIAKEKAEDFIRPNKHDSFVPVRHNTKARWFVDGCSYMSAVADTLEAAKEEIFITDWWLSPEIYLKRIDTVDRERWRLDEILKRKATQGVRVYILLYKEVAAALAIRSDYSKIVLKESHENIKVLRHPDMVGGGGSGKLPLWAHHEKLVVVDQTYAFVGGIDLCFGRWDDHVHRLVDQGLEESTARSEPQHKPKSIPISIQTASMPYTQGSGQGVAALMLIQASRGMALGINNPAYTGDPADSESNQNGAAVSMKEVEKSVVDSGNDASDEDEDKHVANITKRVQAMKQRGRTIRRGMMEKRKQLADKMRGDDEYDSVDEDETLAESLSRKRGMSVSAELKCSEYNKLWIGKDYINFIVKDIIKPEAPLEDEVDRKSVPRLPWHDIATMVSGDTARDVARHFIQRWNHVKTKKQRMNDHYPYILPKSHDYEREFSIPPGHDEAFTVKSQVLRSCEFWSIGIKEAEQSIHHGYIHAIENAKHYVYIENQFFITLGPKQGEVTNKINEALFKRIMHAFKNKETFRVYIILPLIPGFEGKFGDPSGVAMGAIANWNALSINRGANSLLQRLFDNGVMNPSEYVTFYGLRTWEELQGCPVTELIYVHSKLLIADDTVVICGSSNINDRSMLGSRDSEVALFIEDVNFEESLMNGRPYMAGQFASSLRKYLFREHLGLIDQRDPSIDFRDPVCDSFYKDIWLKIASKNTGRFEEVFNCIPNDQIFNYAALREKSSIVPLAFTDPHISREKLQDIKGHLVMYPLLFLKDENLSPPIGTKEYLVPTELWT